MKDVVGKRRLSFYYLLYIQMEEMYKMGISK